MSYLNRVWVAASVAVVNGHTDQGGHKLKSGLRSLHHGKKRFSSSSSSSTGVDHADLRPISSMVGSDHGGSLRGSSGDQADESLRQVMYLNCWGPSWFYIRRRSARLLFNYLWNTCDSPFEAEWKEEEKKEKFSLWWVRVISRKKGRWACLLVN